MVSSICAPDAPSTIQYCMYNTGFSETIVLALLSLTFIAALAYMVAQFMRRPEWEAWSKIQLYHIGISALLAFGALWFAGLACGVSVQLVGCDPFFVANQHIGDLFSNNIRAAIMQLVKAQVSSEYIAGMYVQTGSATFGTGFSPFPVYKVISNNAQLIMSFAMPFASSLLAQQVGLQVVQATAFAIVLPMGILLRAFGVTRDAGSFMIAASIGFFIVLPLTYVMDKMIMEGPDVGDPGFGGTAPAGDQPALCLGASTGYDRASDYSWWQDDNIYPNSVLTFLQKIPFRADKLIAPAMQCIAYVIPQAVFLPALNIIITTAFISSLTKFLTRNFGG